MEWVWKNLLRRYRVRRTAGKFLFLRSPRKLHLIKAGSGFRLQAPVLAIAPTHACKPPQLWSWRRDLNPRPPDYKSGALPTELRQHGKDAPSRKLIPLIPARCPGQLIKLSQGELLAQARGGSASVSCGDEETDRASLDGQPRAAVPTRATLEREITQYQRSYLRNKSWRFSVDLVVWDFWKRRLIAGLWLLVFGAGILTPRALAQQTADFTQAEAMLDFLRSCAASKASPQQLDRLIALPGTELVVQQQNISRRVTMEQYRGVLQAACTGKIAAVKPAEAGTRADRGVEGLTQDVAPSLLWGRENLPLLESRLGELRRNRAIGEALPLARKYLPEQIPLVAKFYVVMGGRAGAAAIEDQLYFDVLSSSWRASIGKSTYTSPGEVVEFFAHEAHHLGYGQILDRKRASFQFTPGEDQAWSFLTAIMMEGSATFLINGHETLSDLHAMPEFPAYLAKAPELLPAMQDVLRHALAGPMSGEDYDQATSAFLGMGYHAAGATMLSVIYERRGLKGVMAAMADPRSLLGAYNDCAPAAGFRFDPKLAGRVAGMGKPHDK
jgi:hypothetical protein